MLKKNPFVVVSRSLKKEFNAAQQIGDLHGGVGEERFNSLINHARMSHGFVTLNHDHNSILDPPRLLQNQQRLRTPVGSAFVLVAGHHRGATDRLDVVVDHLVAGRDGGGGEPAGFRYAFIDMSNHGLAQDASHRLAGESAAAHAGGN